MTFCLFSLKRGLERAFFHFQENWKQIWKKNSKVCFFIAKNFHKVSDGFLFVMPNPLRVTTLDWFGIFCFPYSSIIFCQPQSESASSKYCHWYSKVPTPIASTVNLITSFSSHITSCGCVTILSFCHALTDSLLQSNRQVWHTKKLLRRIP